LLVARLLATAFFLRDQHPADSIMTNDASNEEPVVDVPKAKRKMPKRTRRLSCKRKGKGHRAKADDDAGTMAATTSNDHVTTTTTAAAVLVSPPSINVRGGHDATLDLSGDKESGTESDTESGMKSQHDDDEAMDESNLMSDANATNLDGHNKLAKDILPRNSRNLAIAYLFIHVHQVAEPTLWGGRGGVMATIKDSLGIAKSTSIRAVLLHVAACHQKGVVYNGKTAFVSQNRGPKHILDVHSPTAALIMVALERGFTRQKTLRLVNDWHHQQKKPLITLHQIHSVVERLKPGAGL
jgi:hypothetical protein